MRRLSCYIITCLCCLLLVVPLWAQQDAAKELQQISEHYLSHKSFRTELSYKMYSDIHKSKLLEKQDGFYVRSGDRMYMNALNTEMLHTDQYQVTANHEQKVMLVTRVNPEITLPDPMPMLAAMDSLMQKSGHMKWRAWNKHISQITFLYDEGQIKGAAIFYDPKTYQVREIHLLFANTEGLNWEWESHEPLLVIQYQHTKYNKQISEKYFREEKFIQKQNGKIIPALAYKHYQFFSN